MLNPLLQRVLHRPCHIQEIQKRSYLQKDWWRGKDSNSRRLPSTDLQSAAFDRSATPPQESSPTINRIFTEVNPILKKFNFLSPRISLNRISSYKIINRISSFVFCNKIFVAHHFLLVKNHKF